MTTKREALSISVTTAHHSCKKKLYERATPVMKFLYTDPVKELSYFRCPLCDDEVAVKVVIIDNSGQAANKD